MNSNNFRTEENLEYKFIFKLFIMVIKREYNLEYTKELTV